MSNEEETAKRNMIVELTGCSEVDALSALRDARGNVVEAVDKLLVKPPTQGDRYLPEKPKIDDGLSDEQRELCERGRWLQDKVNVVFSVAHSKTRTPQDLLEPADQGTPAAIPAQISTEEETSVSPRDAVE
jgi:hypothetical protein